MSSSPFSSVRYTYGPLQARNLKRNTPGFVLPPFIQRFLEMVTDEERRSALHRAKLDDLKLRPDTESAIAELEQLRKIGQLEDKERSSAKRAAALQRRIYAVRDNRTNKRKRSDCGK
ncbi:unnamed protein product [Tilletia caries]|uniref:Uncharacterized protein n=1 Tax=Tilletia caries TaxID=13290 RepID=A0A8T8SBT1_9BASI|nr:hypothetical protein CF336_g6201 [Tilletia laevis]KAE8236767.1 hypothetical protein A4X03_0g9333 [Tilletia caries]CAD6927140.1 unnamed protein product [Tilletia controversa]CAD6892055.1 unnamed protein product [Tilletia caries]CAD6975105.1 unnamed protein product [Tilletia controversa]